MSRAALLVAALALGCGTTMVQRHLLGPPGVPHSRPVRTILAGDPVPPAQPVALVQAVGRGLNADLPHVIEGLRDEARQLGCDGVVQLRIARGISTVTAVGFAVRWVAGPPAPPTPVAPPGSAPWSPPPPLPAAPVAPPAASGAVPPWSAP